MMYANEIASSSPQSGLWGDGPAAVVFERSAE